MSESLTSTASSLIRSAELLGDASRRLATLDPGAGHFGAQGPGALGQLGHSLHVLWRGALDARVREATQHGARLDELADSVTRVAGSHGEADDAAHRRSPEGP